MDPTMMKMLRTMTQEQQILYMAMMMDPKQIPMFNQEKIDDTIKIGNTIKNMFKDGKFKTMRMLEDGQVVLE